METKTQEQTEAKEVKEQKPAPKPPTLEDNLVRVLEVLEKLEQRTATLEDIVSEGGINKTPNLLPFAWFAAGIGLMQMGIWALVWVVTGNMLSFGAALVAALGLKALLIGRKLFLSD